MAKTKKPKFLFDGKKDAGDGVYVRAWKEGRSDIVVQVWLGKDAKPEGEPDGDWVMPAALGAGACIDQAVMQTIVR